MIDPNDERLITILDYYGLTKQADIAIEEMSELIHTLCKAKRGRASGDEIRTEIADVMVTVTQLAIALGVADVKREIEYKLNRQIERIREMKE